MFAAARSSCGTAMLRQMRSFAFLSLSAAFRPVSLFMTLGRARPYVCEKGVLGSGNRFKRCRKWPVENGSFMGCGRFRSLFPVVPPGPPKSKRLSPEVSFFALGIHLLDSTPGAIFDHRPSAAPRWRLNSLRDAPSECGLCPPAVMTRISASGTSRRTASSSHGSVRGSCAP